VIAALALALLTGAPQGHPLHWEKKLDVALQKAKAQNKPVMIDFWAEWCEWCHRLDQTTYADANVQQILAGFVTVKIDTEGGNEGPETAAEFGVDSLPTIVFLSPSRRLLLKVTGFQGPGQFPETLASAKEASDKVQGWETTLAKNPNDPTALSELGLHLFDQEMLRESAPLLERARAHDEQRTGRDRKQVRAVLGVIAMQERKYPEAEAVLKEALGLPAVEDYDARVLFILSRMYMRWGKKDEARSCLKTILSAHGASTVASKAKMMLAEMDTKP
jgi:thioredoxin-like negative regulator of GroEL